MNTKKVVGNILGKTNTTLWNGSLLKKDEKLKDYNDKNGYYVGYCQCGCKKCNQGDYHCQGNICKGD